MRGIDGERGARACDRDKTSAYPECAAGAETGALTLTSADAAGSNRLTVAHPTAARRLARFVVDLTLDEVPGRTVEAAERLALDTIGNALAACGDYLECRSNWQVYIDEFAQALALVGRPAQLVEPWQPAQAMTPFERKYADSGHGLWRCVSKRGG